MLEQRVVFAVEVRRFKCANAGCPRRTFAENIDALAGRHRRRTRSQARALYALGHALGGEAAAWLANALGLRTSADTATGLPCPAGHAGPIAIAGGRARAAGTRLAGSPTFVNKKKNGGGRWRRRPFHATTSSTPVRPRHTK